MSSYDKQGNLWALTDKVPLRFEPPHPLNIPELGAKKLHQLMNITKGIADVCVNNKQVAVTRRVEYGGS